MQVTYTSPLTDFGLKKLFIEAQLATLKPHDRQASYEESLKYYRDLKNSNDTAHQDGRKEIAVRMLKKGYFVDDIAELTELSITEINRMKSEMGDSSAV